MPDGFALDYNDGPPVLKAPSLTPHFTVGSQRPCGQRCEEEKSLANRDHLSAEHAMKQSFFPESPSLNAITLADRNETQDISQSMPPAKCPTDSESWVYCWHGAPRSRRCNRAVSLHLRRLQIVNFPRQQRLHHSSSIRPPEPRVKTRGASDENGRAFRLPYTFDESSQNRGITWSGTHSYAALGESQV